MSSSKPYSTRTTTDLMDSHQATSDDMIQCSYEPKRQKINDDRTPPATSNITLPPAPTLEDYLTNDGHLRYCPRPEWVRPIPSSTIADTNTDYYARPSSPHPSQSTAVEMGSDILDVRLRYYREVRNNHVLGVPLEDRELHSRIIDHNHERIEAMNDDDERHMDRMDGNDTVFGEEEVVEQRAIWSSIMRRCDFDPSGDEIQGPLHQPVGEEEQDSNDVVHKTRFAVYGPDRDSALHLAIKHGATEAALALIRSKANVNYSNTKGVTPLMAASLNGDVRLVHALLEEGAAPNAVSVRGSTALIQASHFGKLEVVEKLIQYGATVEQANYKNTTALMRASQEGHERIVELLLRHNCVVNRRNDEQMTALMLGSQRGHVNVVKLLIHFGAEIDATTNQKSSSLMLAVKRKQLEVARVLVTAGAELNLRDEKGRTVVETAQKRGMNDFVEILTTSAQIRFMQKKARTIRNFLMVRLWNLLQAERAFISTGDFVEFLPPETTVHKLSNNRDDPILYRLRPSERALVCAMTMPAPVFELITTFIPLPRLYETRLQMLATRSIADPDSAVSNTMDLIDEVLEEGGLIQAFDKANVTPPSGFRNWDSFQRRRGPCEMRNVNYLPILAHAGPSLSRILKSCHYNMTSHLLEKLKNVQDLQSLVRKQGGVHFETSIANELVLLARMTVHWCQSLTSY